MTFTEAENILLELGEGNPDAASLILMGMALCFEHAEWTAPVYKAMTLPDSAYALAQLEESRMLLRQVVQRFPIMEVDDGR